MSEELEKILEGLTEEQKNAFMEKVKKDAELAVKTAAVEKEKEEAKKLFKATGHWEYSDENNKLTADISEENKKVINIQLDEQNVIELSKEEFFNLFALLKDVYSSVKEDDTKFQNDVLASLREWQKKMSEENDFGNWWSRYTEGLDKIFYPNGGRRNRSRIFHIR